MNIKIISTYDKNYKDLFDLTSPTVIKYAKKYGYSFEYYKVPETFERPSAWFKIKTIQENIKYFDYLLWIDVDAIIFNESYALQDFIVNDKSLYFSKDINGLNSGVMLLKSDKIVEDFFLEVWNQTEDIYHPCWEQTPMRKLIDNNFINIQDKIQYVPQYIFNAYDYSDMIPDPYPDGNLCLESFVFHVPGWPKDKRKNKLQQSINLKLRYFND